MLGSWAMELIIYFHYEGFLNYYTIQEKETFLWRMKREVVHYGGKMQITFSIFSYFRASA